MAPQQPPIVRLWWPLIAVLAVAMGVTFVLTFFSGQGFVPSAPPASDAPGAGEPAFEEIPAEPAVQPVEPSTRSGGDADADEVMEVVPVSATDADGMEISDDPPAPGDPEIDAILHPVPAGPEAGPAAEVLPEGAYRMGESGLEPVKPE